MTSCGRSRPAWPMTREQLEHVLRASAAITGSDHIVVIGSQAILGTFPDAPPELLKSFEVDVFTFRAPEDADLIEGSIGEASPFQVTFGYFAHGVGQETATLPDGWRDRLVEIRTPNTGTATGLCLEVHDLAVSKLAAGRKKDIEYVTGLLRHRLARPDVIEARLGMTPLQLAQRELCVGRLKRVMAAVRGV